MSDFVSFGTSALPGEPQTVGQTADGQGTGERRGRGATVLLPGNAANATALKPGDIIPGTVAGLTADGRLRTDTAHGPVFLDRSTGLKTGAQVQVQVVSTGTQPELKLVQAPEAPPLAPRDRAQPALRPGADLVARLTPHQDAPGRAAPHGQLSHALGTLIDRLGGALRHAPVAHATRAEAPAKPEVAAPAVLSKGPAAQPAQPRGANAVRSDAAQTQPRGADAIRSEAAQPRGADAIRSDAAQPRGADAIRSEAAQPRGADATRSDAAQPRGADAIRSEAAPPRGADAIRSETAPPRGADAIRSEAGQTRAADAVRQPADQGQPRGADAIRRDPATSQPRGADAIRSEAAQPRGADASRPAAEQTQPRGADAIRRDPATTPPRGADAIRAAPPQSAPRPAAPVAAQASAPPPTPAATPPAPTQTTATQTTATTAPAPSTGPSLPEAPAEGRLLNPTQAPPRAEGPAAAVVRHGAAVYRSAAGPLSGGLLSGATATPTAGAAASPALPSAAGPTGAAQTTATPAPTAAAPTATATPGAPGGPAAPGAPTTAAAGGQPTATAPAAQPATAGTTPAPGPTAAPPTPAPAPTAASPSSPAPAAPQTASTPPVPSAAALQTSAAPSGGNAPASPAPAGSAPAATPPAAPPPAALALNVRVLAMHPPGQAMSLPGSHGDVLVGTVTGSSNGQVTIATDAGTLSVRTAPPPVGTRVVMQVIAQPGTVMPTTPADQRAQVAQSLGHAWPSLEAAVQALGQLNPTLAAQTVQTALPQPGPLLSAGIALFLNALTGGNIGEWLGRGAMNALERAGRGDVARKLSDDFGQVSRLAADPATGDWRVVLLPLYAHDRVHQLRLYLRRHGADDGDEDDLGTRFVVEAELSRLGPLQLDGLWRPQRFDLIVRTRQALPADVERGIQEIFLLAGAEANFAGGVGFQVADPFPVAPLDDGDGHAVGVFA